ncbi:MAG: inositol monophosphatase family protein [Candidatus Promineifilaceae bacterium]
MNNWQYELDTAVTIAREAGELLAEGFDKKKEVVHKSTAVDWVTQYDTAAETLIVSRLREKFPEHGLLGEEGSNFAGNGRFQWIVDPLDGTNNFAHNFPVFCVSIALWEGQTPRVGVVYDPLRDECFTAVSGQGAWLTRRGKVMKLSVTNTDNLASSLIATGFPYDRVKQQNGHVTNVAESEAFLRQVQGLRRAGSAALDICYVGAGRLDGYWEYKLHPWDVAAAVLIAQEAGGTVSWIDGSPFRLDKQVAMVASNGRIHQTMLHVIHSANGHVTD